MRFILTANIAAVLDLTIHVSVEGGESFLAETPVNRIGMAAGDNTAWLILRTVDDKVHEADDDIVATVEDGSRYDPGSPGSAAVTVKDNDPLPPPRVTGVTARLIGTDSIRVAWDRIGGAAWYKVESRQYGSSDWNTAAIVLARSLDFSWPVPICLTTYYFRVSAYGNGETYAAEYGPPSSSASVTVPICDPDRVSTPTLAEYNGSLGASWSAPNNGGSTITRYEVRYKRTSVVSWSSAGSVSGRINPITGLTNGTYYHVQARACNVAGCGLWSTSATGKPRTTPGRVPTPTLAEHNGSLTATWSAPDDGGATITRYEVRYKRITVLSWTSAGSVFFRINPITGLTNGTSYHVQARACNVAGCGLWSYSAIGKPRTTPDQVLTPTGAGYNGSLTATWSAPDDGGATITRYEVRYKVTTASSWTSAGSVSGRTKTITGLTNGTTYHVQARACNIAGCGAWSYSAIIGVPPPTPDPTPPGRVATPTGTGYNGSLTASWSAPDNDGGATITRYEVRYKVTTATSWTSAGSVSGRTKTITGLTNGTTYHVQARACNAPGDAGCGLWSTSATIGVSPPTPDPTPPGRVATPTGTGYNGSLTASWSAPDNDGGATITRYEVRYKVTTATSWTSAGSVSGRTKTITGLTNGTTYHVQARACNAPGDAGCGLWSTSATIGVSPPTPDPTPPGRVATPTGTGYNGSLTASWSAPDDGGATITRYEVRYKVTTATSWTSAGSVSGRTKTITGLTNGTTYHVQARACNAPGDAGCGLWSTSATIGVSPPTPDPTPPGRVATPTGAGYNGSLTATWSAPDDGGATITRYEVRYKVTTASSWTSAGSVSGTTKTITGLTSGTSYHVQVRACNVAGCGLWSYSATVNGPTPPDRVSTPTLTPGDRSLTASWSAPSTGGSANTRYEVQHKLTSSSWPSGSGNNNGTSRTRTITGLTNGVSYDVRVRACNTVGCGLWSLSATDRPQAQANRTGPGVPSLAHAGRPESDGELVGPVHRRLGEHQIRGAAQAHVIVMAERFRQQQRHQPNQDDHRVDQRRLL